jgi:hypothetical protein
MKKYRATMHVNFLKIDRNKLTRLYLALREAGWINVETGSFILETTDVNEIWRGIGYLARYSKSVGELNSIIFHVQSSDDFSRNTKLKSDQTGKNALEEISKLPFP